MLHVYNTVVESTYTRVAVQLERAIQCEMVLGGVAEWKNRAVQWHCAEARF